MDIRHTRDVDLVFWRADEASGSQDGVLSTEELVAKIAWIGHGRGAVVGRALDEFGISEEVVREWNRQERLDAATVDRERVATGGRIVADELAQAVFGVEHVLIGLIRDEASGTARILARWGVDPVALAARLEDLAVTVAAMDYTLLDRFGRDLAADTAGPDAGWQPQIDRIVRIVMRRSQNNVLLVGIPPTDPRVVLRRLAHGIASGELADRMPFRRLYDIDMKAVMATRKLQETLGAIGRAARNRGDVLVFIDDWQRYVRRGTTIEGLDTEHAIRILIARGLIQLAGAVTDPAVAQEINDNRPIGFRTFPIRIERTETR